MIAMTTNSSISVKAERGRIPTSGREWRDTLIMAGRRANVYHLGAGYPEAAFALTGAFGTAGTAGGG
jgi:hypothetical protein